MPVAVVTDSTASLPAAVVADRGIRVVPLQVVIGAVSYDEALEAGAEDAEDASGATPALVAASLALFALAPVDGTYVVHVLPGMVLLGLGAGIAFNPVLLAAMGDVEPHEAGLASGVVNTSFMMGGALGLAVLATLSSTRSQDLRGSGHGTAAALTGGYHLAFWIAAALVCASIVVALSVRERTRAVAPARSREGDSGAVPATDAPAA